MYPILSSHVDRCAKHLLRAGVVIAAMMLVGCVTAPPTWRGLETNSEAQPMPDSTQQVGGQKQSPEVATVNKQNSNVPAQIFTGRSRSAIGAAPLASKAENTGGEIVLNFADTPVRAAVQIILGDHLGQSYQVADDVQGLVSLNNATGFRSVDLIPTLETLLSSVDARLEETDAGYQVVSGAKQSLITNRGNFEIIPLRYVDAHEFSKLLDGYQVSATAIEKGNLLAVSGTQEKLRQVRTLARSFDINWLEDMSIGLFPVKSASAAKVREELLAMFGNDIESEVAGALRIVAVERSNSVMVISPQRDYVKLMGDWVARLDNIGSAPDQKFFVYQAQNGRASDLADLLGQMFGTSVKDVETIIGDEPQTQQNQGTFRVIADESTNSIIVTGGSHHYEAVRQALAELDNAPLQVLVEAKIMELTLTDDLRYGLEWFLDGSRASSNTSARLDFGNTGIAAVTPGFSYVIERAGEVRAALNGLADDSRLKVLSSPSLMVLNNKTASILVGDEVPVPIRQATSNISPDAPTVNEIEYRNTGILLTVSPRVNSGGMVTMDISQEVSSVSSNTSSEIDAPTIQQRQVNSTVSIRTGQTVVLGGLIREQDTLRESGIPLLKDLPGLGKLFGSTNNRMQRTELVVLITPRIVSTERDNDAITEEYRSKMIGLKPISLRTL